MNRFLGDGAWCCTYGGQQRDIARQRFKVPPYRHIKILKYDTGSLYEHLKCYIYHVISSYTPTSPVSHFATHCRCRQLFRSSTCALITPKVDSVLSERITHFLERAYVLDREGRPESEVPLLQLLSKPMQRELRFARFEGCLRCWDQNL